MMKYKSFGLYRFPVLIILEFLTMLQIPWYSSARLQRCILYENQTHLNHKYCLPRHWKTRKTVVFPANKFPTALLRMTKRPTRVWISRRRCFLATSTSREAIGILRPENGKTKVSIVMVGSLKFRLDVMRAYLVIVASINIPTHSEIGYFHRQVDADQTVPARQVSVDKPLSCQVLHTRRYL